MQMQQFGFGLYNKVKLMKYILPLVLVLTACSEHDSPSYDVLLNPIKGGGVVINYDPNSSLENIAEIVSTLNEQEANIFNSSLSWYATESEFGFEHIHLKTARQLVNIVNCLKVTDKESDSFCFQ